MSVPSLNVSIFDSAVYSPLFSYPPMHELWSDTAMVQAWLDYEIALASAQAQLGVIPQAAADAIAKAARLEHIDWQQLADDTRKVGMAVKPVVDQVAAAGNEQVKHYLHWGSTTQDLLDSGQAMRLAKALALIKTQLQQVIKQLAAMANTHRHTLMVARTNAQDASPSTWGFHVSGYLSEFCRHYQRLAQITPRATTGMYGSAIGNLSSAGPNGIAIRNLLLDKLGLPRPVGQWNASHDSLVEVIQFFALVHGSLQRIANDVELMSRASIAELREGEEGGGSSTMPHKANPRAANSIQAMARLGWMYASSAPNMLDQTDVRSSAARMLDWSLLPESCLAVSGALHRGEKMLTHLHVNSEQMRENFKASRHLIMSESVMMKVADKVGRDQGYRLVKEAIARHQDSSMQLEDILLTSPELMQYFSYDELKAACDPANHLGANDALIDEALAFAKVVLD